MDRLDLIIEIQKLIYSEEYQTEFGDFPLVNYSYDELIAIYEQVLRESGKYVLSTWEGKTLFNYIDDAVKVGQRESYCWNIRYGDMICCTGTGNKVTYTDEYQQWYMDRQKSLEAIRGK